MTHFDSHEGVLDARGGPAAAWCFRFASNLPVTRMGRATSGDVGTDVASRALGDATLRHEPAAYARLLIETGAPLCARMTSIDVWRRIHPQWRPMVVDVNEGDQLVAAALLGWRSRWGFIDVVRLGPQDQAGWIAGRDAAALCKLSRAVRDRLDGLRRPWRLRLNNLRNTESDVASLLSAWPRAGVSDIAHSAELDVSTNPSFNEVSSRNTRAAVAKARNRIAHFGHRLALLWLTEAADIAAVLPQVDRVHQARNRQLRGDAKGLDYPATSAQFIQRVVAYADQRRVRLLVTCIDGDLAAFAVCLLDHRVLHVYENLAAPKWLAFSPGAIANHEVSAHAWADPAIDTVDWGLGLQRYKLSGRAQLVTHRSCEAFSSAAAQWLAGAQAWRRSALSFLTPASRALRPRWLVDP